MVLICGNTFAPVCRFDNQRLLLAIAAAKDWRIISLDVQNVLLSWILDKNELKSIVHLSKLSSKRTFTLVEQGHLVRWLL